MLSEQISFVYRGLTVRSHSQWLGLGCGQVLFGGCSGVGGTLSNSP